MCKFLILKYISTYSAYELLQELLMNFNTCSVTLLTICPCYFFVKKLFFNQICHEALVAIPAFHSIYCKCDFLRIHQWQW